MQFVFCFIKPSYQNCICQTNLGMRELSKKSLVGKIDQDISVLKSFLDSFGQMYAKAVRLRENTAPEFNLFEIINISSYEAWVHTPLLADFLSPSGKHSQGRLFFDAFMSHLFPDNFRPDTINSISVYPECHTANGNIDLLIEYKEKEVLKAIVIENKIYARDQKEQLERYYNFKADDDEMLLLVYLTPEGASPTSHSISKELYDRLRTINKLREMSYVKDLSTILEGTIPKIKAPVVRETLLQYIQTIKSL